MHTVIFFIACLLLTSSMSSSQEYQNADGFRIGPQLDLNLAMDISNYHVGSTTNSGRPGYAMGLLADIPLSVSTAIRTGLHYYTLGFYDKNTKIDLPSQDLSRMMITRGTFHYVSLSTMIRHDHLLAGMQFGLPVDSYIENCRAEPPLVPSKIITTGTRDINVLIEARAGYEFQFHEAQDGTLWYVSIIAAYPVTSMLVSSAQTRPRLDDNFRLPSISMSCVWFLPKR